MIVASKVADRDATAPAAKVYLLMSSHTGRVLAYRLVSDGGCDQC